MTGSASVQSAINCATPPGGLVGWWPAEDHGYDIVGKRFTVVQGDATYSAGHVGRAFSFGGTGGRVRVLESTANDLSRMPRWTIEAWVKPASFVNATYPMIYSEGNRIVTLGLQNGTGKLESWVNNDNARRLVGTNVLASNDWNHVALVYDGGRRLLYLNGVLDGSTNTPAITDDGSGASIGQSGANDPTTIFQGAVDELGLYNAALSAAQIADIFSAGTAGKCFSESPTPTFVLDPVSQNAFLGEQVTLAALAAGCPDISYQWLLNGTPINGATGYSFALSNLNFTDAGGYALRATNPFGSSTSAVAQIVVLWCTDPPTNIVAWWPADGSGIDAITNHHDGAIWGGTTFGPGVTGSAFGFNGTNAYVAVPDSLTLSPHLGANGEMTVEAWVKLDQLPQADAVTGQNRGTVLAKASPGQWEYGLSITTTGIPEFHAWNLNGGTNAVVSGGQILTGQWHHIVATFKKGDAARLYQDNRLVGTSTNFTGDTGDGNSPLYIGRRGDAQFLNGWVDEAGLYSRALTAEEVAALYAAKETGKCSAAPGPAPWFTRQPENQSGYLLLGAGLTSFANGTPRPSYQWYKSNETSWVILPGQTKGSLVFTSLSQNFEGNYRAVATNPRGSTTSDSAYLEVVPHDILTGGDSFEKGWNGWTTDGAVWQVGAPISGPGGAHHSNNVAATILGGNYTDDTNGLLISPPLVLPSSGEAPRLRFWHWYSFGDAGGRDFGEVRIKIGTGSWQPLARFVSSSSGVWSRQGIDLLAYAGQTVQFGFYFESHGYQNPNYPYNWILDPEAGWYIDEVKLESGPSQTLQTNAPETFDRGLGDWATLGGTWEIGRPTSGPGGAHSGPNVAATVLSGNYYDDTSGWLISPRFDVPSTDQNPRLRFWHWYNIGGHDAVQLRLKAGTNSWQTLAIFTSTSSDVWSQQGIDLTAFAGQSVQIGFYFESHGYQNPNYPYNWILDPAPGWYIDDVMLVSGPYRSPQPNVTEEFEAGITDWYVDGGTWELGKPSSGPNVAHSGTNCFATRLTGNYTDDTSGLLISPPLVLPSSGEAPRLRFWHWYSFGDAGGRDFGEVRIKIGTGSWQPLARFVSSSSGVWSRQGIDLLAYAGQTVQFGFYFESHGYQNPNYPYNWILDPGAGWYIDDVTVESGPFSSVQPETFEGGWADWATWGGTWEVGQPASGPGSTHSGTAVAATVLGGNYYDDTSGWFISPPLTVPALDQNPSLRFWHWYNIGGHDKVEVRLKAGSNPWLTLATFTSSSSSVWSQQRLDLLTYASQSVQIGFYFESHGYQNPNYPYNWILDPAPGWYIDDLFIKRGSLAIASISDQMINEHETLTFPVTVIGTTPDSCVSYQLIDPPKGATIDPTTGVFSWTPEECQGPGLYNIGIYVVDFCNNEANDLGFVKVTVNEVNEPPWLLPAEGTAYAGQTNLITLCSDDPDCPRNPLRYELLAPVPAWTTIDASTGVVRCTPTLAHVGTHNLRVRLCDGGTPNYCVTNTLTLGVTTNEYGLEIQQITADDVRFILHDGSIAVDYILQQAEQICGCPCETVWEDVGRITPTEMPYAVDRVMDRRYGFFRLRETPRLP